MVEGLQLTEATQYIIQLDSVKWTSADTRKTKEGEKRFYTCLKEIIYENEEEEEINHVELRIPAGVDTTQPKCGRGKPKKIIDDFQATQSNKRAALNNNQNDADHVYESRNKNDITENVWCSIKNGQGNILLGCVYRPPNSSNLTNRNITELLAEATIKWSKNGYSEIFPNDQGSSFFVDNVFDCFLNQMVVKHTFQVSDGCTTNTLDLILTTCENRFTKIVNQPPLGGLDRGHTV
ncbi:RNA-directed DNA polymerase from mobile element jockey-like [Brachionus plicatilis]|uniref:RNA-directed DNA polymerase from mobile element jockey-like n=1 Tax=Brachionus plicatilis TaxID=10195 RepID=A0A3M7RTR4_BRAPC|nr:RNA-directed DNA polymerase from mobile element jockey-like [Brachionus plicatilis]